MKALHSVTFILLVVGGLNWLAAAFGYNVVDKVFGMGSQVSVIIYVLVGLSAIAQVATHKSYCKYCASMGGSM